MASSFLKSAHVYPSLGGRTTTAAIWPVCVAPILASPQQTNVFYWAIATGSCCSDASMPCDYWQQQSYNGAVKITYTEFYPAVSAAVQDAVTLNKLTVGDGKGGGAVYVVYGDSERELERAKIVSSVVSSVVFVGTMGLVYYRAKTGDY